MYIAAFYIKKHICFYLQNIKKITEQKICTKIRLILLLLIKFTQNVKCSKKLKFFEIIYNSQFKKFSRMKNGLLSNFPFNIRHILRGHFNTVLVA